MSEPPVVIITGAGRGIGRACAELSARCGHRLVLNDLGCQRDGSGRDPSVIESLVQALRADGASVVGDSEDASVHDGGERLVRLAIESWGRVDALVTCVGVRRDRGFLKLEESDFDVSMQSHVFGPLRLLQAASRHWIDQKIPGRAVLVGGPSAFFGNARQSAQAASQAALIGVARSAAVELRRHGIRINVVVPTARTRLTEDTPLFKGIAADSMRPEHVAVLVGHLLSSAGEQVHGEVLGVAGGRIYAIQNRETTGAFVEGRGFRMSEIADAWSEITRS